MLVYSRQTILDKFIQKNLFPDKAVNVFQYKSCGSRARIDGDIRQFFFVAGAAEFGKQLLEPEL
jgi:hypothetical protein